MQILLTNDDGIDAEGLRALESAARSFGTVITVAPALPHSSLSHAITTHRPLRITDHGSDRYAVHGTPADCVRVALAEICPRVDWVFAGINHGGNLGVDIFYSGTVAAVREAVIHGRRGIAFSHYKRREYEYEWIRTADTAERVIAELTAEDWMDGHLWNVNFPHDPSSSAEPIVMRSTVNPGALPLCFRRDDDGGLVYDGDYHARLREPGSDVAVCFGGAVSVSRIRLF